MKTYQVEGRIHRTADVSIMAETREAAYVKFKETFPDYKVDAIDDRLVVGHCENTGKPIFEGDKYSEDSDGVMWLNN